MIEVGKYKIIKQLGKGHFGEVFLALDRALDAEKAIKLMKIKNPNEYINELSEAQLLYQCQHKHIVKINEANIFIIDNEPTVCIDMEYISGGSLENKLNQGFITSIQAVQYMRDILFGLDYLHRKKIFHRDIKPANIMLDNNVAKLSDFGLATRNSQNLTGKHYCYTPHLAPEMFKDGSVLDEPTIQTEIFAVGITLFRLVCNISNWEDIMGSTMDYKIFQKGKLISYIGFPQYVPMKIKRIINKACHHDKEKRYQTAIEMGQALSKLKPNIDWKKEEENYWKGFDSKSKEYSIHINKKNEVIIKKNGRKLPSVCKCFATSSEASNYFFKYISDSTIE